jgi:hypothetical protein
MNGAAIIFTPDGLGHGLYTDAIPLGRIGNLHIERATTIEFDNQTQYWRVYDPAGFPLFNAPTRELCLEWEQAYLGAREDQKHELQHGFDPASAGA